MIEEHASVVLTEPLPSAGLEAGEVGVVVHVHRNGEAFEVEFITLDGNIAVISLAFFPLAHAILLQKIRRQVPGPSLWYENISPARRVAWVRPRIGTPR